MVAACRAGDSSTVARILAQGAAPDTCSSEGLPLLHLAVQGGHTSLLQTLLNTPHMDLNGKDGSGQTALLLACSEGALFWNSSDLGFVGSQAGTRWRACWCGRPWT